MKLIKNIITLIILTLAVIGFMSIGGMDMLKKPFSNFGWFNKSQETLMDKANKIANFSNINQEEYEISKTANVMGYKAVVAEHNASGQKFIVIDSGKEPLRLSVLFRLPRSGLPWRSSRLQLLPFHLMAVSQGRTVRIYGS